MHRKHIRATDAGTGTDVDVPTAIWADGQFLIYLGGELFTQFVVQSHNTSTDNAVARWDGTTGHLIQDSTVIIDDAGAVTGVTTMNGVPPGDWVRGPAAGGSTDNAITRWDGTTGRLVQNSVVIVNDTGDITGVTSINTIPVGDFVRGPTPATATDNALARWDATTGRLIQDSLIIVGDTGNASGFLNISTTTINSRNPNRWVDGPLSTGTVTNNHVALWNTATGREIKDSPVTIDPTTGDITTPGDMTPGTVSGIPVGVLVKSSGGTPHPDTAVARWRAGAGNPIDDSTVFLDNSGNLTGVGLLNGVFNPNIGVQNAGTSVDRNIAMFSGTGGKSIADSGFGIDNIVGSPGATTVNAIAKYNSPVTPGKRIQASGILIDASNNVTGMGTLNTRTIADFITGPATAVNANLLGFNGTSGKAAYDTGLSAGSVVQQASGSVTSLTLASYSGTTGLFLTNSNILASRVVQGPASGGSTDNTLAVWDGVTGRLLKDGSTTAIAVDPSTGVITTPVGVLVHSGATHTDNAAVRWDGTGAHTQDSVVIIGDTGNVTGLGTLNTRTIANWVDGPASATDNTLPRYDGTTGKLIQASGITVADTTNNITGAGTINGVDITAHAARHLGGGADTLLGAGFIAGDLLSYAGVGSLFTRFPASAIPNFTIGYMSARTIGANTGIDNYGGASSGQNVIFLILIPYALSDSSTLQFKYTLTGSATSSGVGIQCGNIGLLTTVSGTYGTLTGIPAAGLMIISGMFTGAGDISFTMNVTGSGIVAKNSFVMYCQVL